MTVTVMDEDMVVDDLVGRVTVDLEEVRQKLKIMKWYTLEYKNKKAGEILLELDFNRISTVPPPQSSGALGCGQQP